METKKTVCPLDCPDACGVVATGDGDRITAITGDKEHPFTKGFLCRKVSTYHERVHSPDRILHPMVRTGAKGSGQFSRISWDEAWDQLVSRLSRIRADHGGEALLPYSYAGNMGHISRTAGDPFFHRSSKPSVPRLPRPVGHSTMAAARRHLPKRPWMRS